MMRRLALAFRVSPSLAWGQADPQTLADIRNGIASLRRKSGGCGPSCPRRGSSPPGVAGNTRSSGLNAIEAALQRLTSKTEELEFRINRITRTARTGWADSSSGSVRDREGLRPCRC
jgi:hypothetical protein